MGKYPPVGDHWVDPRRFIGQRFFLLHTCGFSSPHDYVAKIVGLSAGRIRLTALAHTEKRWGISLSFYRPVELSRALPHYDTLDEAKAALRSEFDRWLACALEHPKQVTWHGADTKRDPASDPPIDSETGTWLVDPSSGIFIMCNLCAMNHSRDEVRVLIKALRDLNNNQLPMPGIFPDYEAPIVRMENGERIIANARWGMPSPKFALEGKMTDPGITNVRNTTSSHWRRWLSPANRCLVPFTSLSEPGTLPDGKKTIAWFALNEARPVAFFAGIWIPQWKSIRKLKEGEMTSELYAFLTCEPNADVAPIHPKAMPVILTKPAEWDAWLSAEWSEVASLQRPLPDHSLQVVARGEKKDG